MVMFSVTTLVLHVPLCYLLVFKFGFGFRGAALASSLLNWLNVVLACIVCLILIEIQENVDVKIL